MQYRARFEGLIESIRACPALALGGAEIGPPTAPIDLLAAQARAGGAWPAGMTELYQEVSFVRIAYSFVDAPPSQGRGSTRSVRPADAAERPVRW